MTIIICPGIHEADLTESFISGCWSGLTADSLSHERENILVAPVPGVLAVSSLHILQFLRDRHSHSVSERSPAIGDGGTPAFSDRLHDKLESPVIFISFSAGVVGAIGAAWQWQLLGGDVKAFIAIDGWGVPLWGNFPIHRLSHDYFTHWSSSLLGTGQDNFYAEPAVDHLTIWRSPQTVQGWWVNSSPGEITTPKTRLTAAEFLHLLLKRYK